MQEELPEGGENLMQEEPEAYSLMQEESSEGALGLYGRPTKPIFRMD